MTLCNWCRSEAVFRKYVRTGLLSGEWIEVAHGRDESLPVGLDDGETCSRCGAEPNESEKPRRIVGVPQ